MTRASLLLVVLLALPASVPAADNGLPLPPAPVRVVIPAVPAFEAALTGAYRQALTGELPEGNAVATAWRRTQVGSKLEAEWRKLGEDVAWTWSDVQKLRPSRLGLSLLSPGSLEAVLVVDTPLAALPSPLPAGEGKTHAGIAYSLVARGSGDGTDDDRRMGLAWARHGGLLLLATSERALLLALDEAAAGRSFAPALPGVVSMALDMDALSQDRYFKREFLFPPTPSGRVDAALRLEGGGLVEVRQGSGASEGAALVFSARGAMAAAWEPDAAGAWPAFRAALLEPGPELRDKPVPPLGPLPAAAALVEDRYLVNLEKPPLRNDAPWEEGDVARGRELFARAGLRGFGYAVSEDGSRLMVFEWPQSLMADLDGACRATLHRRGGPVSAHDVQGATELRFGPDLPALAWKRSGPYVWFAASARRLGDVPAAKAEAEVVRWASLDLRAARAEGARWARAEGPASPESVRPFSDRILGILGWMPETSGLLVTRRRAASGWTERVEFGPAKAP